MVSSKGIFVHNDTKLFETYYSSSKGGISFIILAKESVLLIVYLFLQRGI